MVTRVVKIGRVNQAEIRNRPDFIYVGRSFAAPGIPWFEGSLLSNPFFAAGSRVGVNKNVCNPLFLGSLLPDDLVDPSPLHLVSLYVAWFTNHIQESAAFDHLRGHLLGCWCCDYDGVTIPARPCHAVWLAVQCDHPGAPFPWRPAVQASLF